MEHYVTLFDSLFLPQGMALHMSMERHAGPYRLWVLCMDDEVHGALQKAALPNVSLLKLSALETEQLREVRPGRTKGEYCWTVTPFAPRFVFEADASVQRVTYIDADMWFRKSPEAIFREFEASGKQVLLTDHGYAPEHDQTATSGQFCVQLMTFTRAGGEVVRKWWEERCLEWCFDRMEEGRFGDQRYLDDWPERFADSVHVLQHPEWMLAPWNAMRFPYGNGILHHFQGVRIITDKQCALSRYPIPPVALANLYWPYLRDLRAGVVMMQGTGWKLGMQGQCSREGKLTRFREMIRALYRLRWYYCPAKKCIW